MINSDRGWHYMKGAGQINDNLMLKEIMGSFTYGKIIKESIQNSLDASISDDSVEIEYLLLKMEKGYKELFAELDIDKNKFLQRFRLMKTFYENNDYGRKINKTEELIELFEGEDNQDCYVLIIKDKNTSGLTLKNKKNAKSRFEAFFFFSGLPRKEKGRRGSYGKGRNAIIHGSQAQMIIVKSRPYNRDQTYQYGMGIHGIFEKNNETYPGTCFYGIKKKDKEKPNPIIISDEKKQLNESGTNIILPFFRIKADFIEKDLNEEYEDIEDFFFTKFSKEIKKWFSPAIVREKLKIKLTYCIKNSKKDILKTIKSEEITKSNIGIKYLELFNSDDKKLKNDSKLFQNQIQKEIKEFIWLKSERDDRKKTKFEIENQLRILNINRKNYKDNRDLYEDFKDSVIFVRDNMIIEYYKIRSASMSYSGDFVAIFEIFDDENEVKSSDKFYEFLRSCEPVTHDKLDGTVAEDVFPCAKRRLNCIRKEIRDKIEESQKISNKPVSSVKHLNKNIQQYFPKKIKIIEKKNYSPRSGYSEAELEHKKSEDDSKKPNGKKMDKKKSANDNKKKGQRKIRRVDTKLMKKYNRKTGKNFRNKTGELTRDYIKWRNKRNEKKGKHRQKKKKFVRSNQKKQKKTDFSINYTQEYSRPGGKHITEFENIKFDKQKNKYFFTKELKREEISKIDHISYLFYYDKENWRTRKATKLPTKIYEFETENEYDQIIFEVDVSDIPEIVRNILKIYYSLKLHY